MKLDKTSIDYQMNLEELREMEECVPMTLPERHAIRKWVHDGNDVESNPWDYRDGDEVQLNFLQAFRLEFGYSSGPWDCWRGLRFLENVRRVADTVKGQLPGLESYHVRN